MDRIYCKCGLLLLINTPSLVRILKLKIFSYAEKLINETTKITEIHKIISIVIVKQCYHRLVKDERNFLYFSEKNLIPLNVNPHP